MLLLLLGCAKQAEIQALHAEVAQLEARVAVLEGAKRATPTPSDPARTEAARAMIEKAQEEIKREDWPLARATLEELLATYPDTTGGSLARRLLPEIAILGAPAPPIEVSLWFQGTYAWADEPLTLVVFFETWCPHCQREIPRLNETLATWQPRGLAVVGFTKVNKSATDDTVRAFIKDHDLKFPIGREQNGSLSAAFAVTGIPAAALVKNGVIVWRGHPARLDPATLERHLAL